MLPFGRFPGVDTVLGPEMKSTGEVMGIDADPGMALAKAMVAAGHALPAAGSVFVSVANRDKRAIVFPARRLADLGFRLLATSGTAGVLERAGIAVERVAKVSEGPDNVVELIRAGAVDLVINTPFGRAPRSDGSFIRTAAAAAGVPCITTLPGRLRRRPGDRGAPRRPDRTAVDPGAPRRGAPTSRPGAADVRCRRGGRVAGRGEGPAA